MLHFLLANAEASRFWSSDLWCAVVAIAAVSLVYAATRHERMTPILIHAGRVALWIAGFMLAVFVVMQFIGSLT
jgi:cytochrome c oxidase assembly factor CtaG